MTDNTHNEPLSVPAAAGMLKMSASYFMRFFRAATGLTFSRYVDHLRTSRAYQLLLESDLSLAQIAAETGFCDQCHMNRQIRRRFGTTPGRIRSQELTPGGESWMTARTVRVGQRFTRVHSVFQA